MSDAPQHNDFCIAIGADFRRTLTLTNSDGILFDFTSPDPWSAKMDIRTGKSQDSDLIVSLTTANGRITMGSDGSITLSLTASLTSTDQNILDNAGKTGHFDLFIFPPATSTDQTRRLLFGKIKILEAVTDVSV